MVSKQNIIRWFFIVSAFCPSSFSSSAITIITSRGIILGLDGKSVDRCVGPCPSPRESKKIVLVQDRVAVGSVGLYAVLGDAHNVAPYYFPALIGQIKARLPAEASVSRVSEIAKEEVEKFSSWFDTYLKRGLLQQEDSPGDYPLEYLIAGYQAGVPTIYSIYVEVDWQQLHVKGIQRVLMRPERNGQEDFAIYGVGSKRVLQELKQEQGDLYQRVISKAPLESRMLSGKRELSVNQASNLVRALLEVEAEANPEQVGPPFTIVTIPRNGRLLVSGIDAQVHSEPGPLHNHEPCLEAAKSLPVKRLVGVKAVLLFKCISFSVVTLRLADGCLPFLIARFANLGLVRTG